MKKNENITSTCYLAKKVEKMVGKVNLLLEKTGWGFRKQKCLYQHAADLNPSCFLFVFVLRYKPAPEDQIMRAFEVLDHENKGYLTTEELTKYMSEEGHNFICCSSHYPSFSQGLAVAHLVVSMVNALNFLFFFFFFYLQLSFFIRVHLSETCSAHSLH